MRRDYIDSMKTNGFGEFINACESLKNCKYVVAENKISLLLKSIADNKQLYSMFGAALMGFDYKSVFTDCVAGSSFLLPNDLKTAVALVFRILLDIDGGKMPLCNFLEAYFYTESLNESYARFSLEVISPFESYCRLFFSQTDTSGGEFLVADEEMAKAYDSVNDKFREDLRADALSGIAALLDFADDNIDGAIERAEYSACLNGLVRAIKSGDYDNIISAFLGVKYAVSYFFKSSKTVLDVYKKLEYDIKHMSN